MLIAYPNIENMKKRMLCTSQTMIWAKYLNLAMHTTKTKNKIHYKGCPVCGVISCNTNKLKNV